MKALKSRKRYDTEKEYERLDREYEERQRKLAAMTPEERKEYMEKKSKRMKNLIQIMGMVHAINSQFEDYEYKDYERQLK